MLIFKEDLTESQMKTLITKFVKLAIKSERFKFKSFDLIKDYLSKEQLFNILESHPSLLENEEVMILIEPPIAGYPKTPEPEPL